MDSPSILGSPTSGSAASGGSPRKRLMRSRNSAKSSRLNALSSDSMGTLCRTLAKPAAGAAPTRSDGPPGAASPGKRASMAA